MKTIFVTGMAGTGKSTIADALKEKGIRVIDVDHVPGLCSWVHNDTKEKVDEKNPDGAFMETHDYICDMDMLNKLIHESDDDVFIFGAVGENKPFIEIADTVILLQCDPDVLLERVRTRTTNEFGKNEETQNIILAWRKVFDPLMLEAGALPVDASKPIDEVIDRVLEIGCK